MCYYCCTPGVLLYYCLYRHRFVRFNIQQAILVDVCTIVLGLLGSAVGYLDPEGEQVLTNFAFYCLVAAVVYAVVETVRGRTANEVGGGRGIFHKVDASLFIEALKKYKRGTAVFQTSSMYDTTTTTTVMVEKDMKRVHLLGHMP